mmetsp:Transcript_2580/g.8867  ORF Transcript_2580/g.8867 Transcript_2580/m.8867 type:complete len:206 (+) Transcript_2580:894-1511(+)
MEADRALSAGGRLGTRSMSMPRFGMESEWREKKPRQRLLVWKLRPTVFVPGGSGPYSPAASSAMRTSWSSSDAEGEGGAVEPDRVPVKVCVRSCGHVSRSVAGVHSAGTCRSTTFVGFVATRKRPVRSVSLRGGTASFAALPSLAASPPPAASPSAVAFAAADVAVAVAVPSAAARSISIKNSRWWPMALRKVILSTSVCGPSTS